MHRQKSKQTEEEKREEKTTAKNKSSTCRQKAACKPKHAKNCQFNCQRKFVESSRLLLLSEGGGKGGGGGKGEGRWGRGQGKGDEEEAAAAGALPPDAAHAADGSPIDPGPTAHAVEGLD